MNSRERIKTIISGGTPDRCGFWIGNPDAKTWPIYHSYFGTKTEEDLRVKLGDDFRWICSWGYDSPAGRSPWAIPGKTAHGTAGPLANVETVEELDDCYDWPDARYATFADTLDTLKTTGDYYRAGGFWSCFYHIVMDLFGMEQYMMKMMTHPAVVDAVTERVGRFYYDANERLFAAAGSELDAFFFGNDFGTQRSLICGPKQFDRFIMPWFKKFTDQGRRFGLQVILHSCGSIHKVIGRLIDAQVDCLHPLQAKAADMDAETLARDFKGKIAFLGGIDTQELLVNGSPEDIKAEVRRVKQLLGPNLIISPSHEALLPDVPPKNVAAMAEAAVEG